MRIGKSLHKMLSSNKYQKVFLYRECTIKISIKKELNKRDIYRLNLTRVHYRNKNLEKKSPI